MIQCFRGHETNLGNRLVEAIGAERLRLPVVLVNDQVVSDGAKLNEGLVVRKVAEILHGSTLERDTFKNDV